MAAQMKRLLLLFAFAVPLRAANLVNNPSFNADTSGWINTSGSSQIVMSWQRLDALKSASSGSMAVTFTSTAPNVTSGISQCVAIPAGMARYDFGARVMIPGSQIAGGAALIVTQFSAPGCGGGISSQSAPVFTARSNGAFTPIAMKGRDVAPGAASALVSLDVNTGAAGPLTVYFDDVYFGPTASCVPDDTTACLNGGRFSVTAGFAPPTQGFLADAHLIQLTADTAYMWFFTQNNVEVTAKVLQACVVNDRQWVFVSGLTNVRVVITVRDMQTGMTRTYENPLNSTFATTLDTDAFACP
jgi:hypothetical protein